MVTLPYHVKIAPAARLQIRALPSKQQKMIIKLLETLAINPRPPGVKKIEGMIGLYDESINSHRLIYKVEEQEVLLLLVKPSHMKQE
jgi:mRNA interferase RelE/StbE